MFDTIRRVLCQCVTTSGLPTSHRISWARIGGNSRVASPAGTSLEDALRPARSLVFLHLNAKQLSKPSYSVRDPPRVEYDGEGLASVLAYMALNDPDGFDELLAHMRSLVPHLKRIRFRKAPVRRIEKEYLRVGDESVERRSSRVYQGEAMLFDFTNAENVSAHTISEGTLMLLGILTVLLGPSHPEILLMDDIEHGLHPLAQRSLLGVLEQVMQKFRDLQILASAHSPYLLDQLRPEQIRLMSNQEGWVRDLRTIGGASSIRQVEGRNGAG